ncbi:FkbM family methyltransferase [Sorangium sp. So ce281]|uniref:FkbM family methyltransferase n=1 Tax=Sorangium sp. So ce281 TaxID=3133293 RepID=UPI003F629D31
MLGDTEYKRVPKELLAEALKRGAHAPFDPLLCAYQYLFERLAVPRTGVLHLGGHIGQELPMYAALGFRRVVMVEPLEREFAQLQRRVDAFNATCGPIADFIDDPVRPRAYAVRCAVADRSGEVSFCRTHMTSLSSLSRPVPENFAEQWEEARSLPWYKRPVGWLTTALQTATALRYQEIKVPCTTLDGLVGGLPYGWRASDFSYLRMNIQGAELRALQGGAQTLEHVRLIDLETNISRRYEDAPARQDFDRLLSGHGFSCVFAYRIGGLGNLVYARTRGVAQA